MAKVTAPMLSFGGSGSLAKTIVYSKWKGIPYARQHVIPANPQSTAQTLTRDIFANASALWKGAPALFIAPWDAFAAGQPLTGRNAFQGRFVATLRGDTDLDDMIFSPGAKGGLAPLSIVVTPGATQLSVAITMPATPTGWTLTSGIAAALVDAAPEAITALTITANEDVSDPYTAVLTGLTASVLYQVGAWVKWAKPDGSVAYGPSINATGTPTA